MFFFKTDAGRSFGELALINTDCIRNATIIADEKTDLVIVNRDLYKRSLHEFQSKDFEDRKRFVDSHAMFDNWLPKYKKQMAMSLRREKVFFDSTIVRQGAPVDGIMFLLRWLEFCNGVTPIGVDWIDTPMNAQFYMLRWLEF